jgi:hypothetical protein
MKAIFRLGLPVTVVALVACAPQEKEKTVKTFEIKTSPQKAEVYVDNRFIGLSPAKLTLSFTSPYETHILLVKKYGYKPAERKLTKATPQLVFIKLKPAEKKKIAYLVPSYTTGGLSFNVKYEYAYKDTIENSPNAYQVKAVLQLNNINQLLGPIDAKSGKLVYTLIKPKVLINSDVYVLYLEILNNILDKTYALLENPSVANAKELISYIKRNEPYLSQIEEESQIFGNKINVRETVGEIKNIATLISGKDKSGLLALLNSSEKAKRTILYEYLQNLRSLAESLEEAKETLKTMKPKEFYSEIWMIDLRRGFAKTKLTDAQNRWIDNNPTVTGNGKWVYFSSNRLADTFNIWRIGTFGGRGLTRLTISRYTNDLYPSVDSANTLLAYESIPVGSSTPQIWTVNPDGTLPSQLRSGQQPNLCSDGSKIVFVRKNPTTGKFQIWLMNSDGTGETLLSQDPNVNDMYPHFSPDCKWIVFTSDAGGNKDIYVMKIDGSHRTQLTTNPSTDIYPTWGNDGYIYFVSNRGLVWGVWSLKPNLSGF